MQKLKVMLRDGNELIFENVSLYFMENDFLRIYHEGLQTYVNEKDIIHYTVEEM